MLIECNELSENAASASLGGNNGFVGLKTQLEDITMHFVGITLKLAGWAIRSLQKSTFSALMQICSTLLKTLVYEKAACLPVIWTRLTAREGQLQKVHNTNCTVFAATQSSFLTPHQNLVTLCAKWLFSNIAALEFSCKAALARTDERFSGHR